MDPLIFLGAATLDPTLSTVIGLVTNLGSAGAAVVVVWFFLNYLRSDAAQRDQRYEALTRTVTERLVDNSQAMREFARSVNGICRAAEQAPPRRGGHQP